MRVMTTRITQSDYDEDGNLVLVKCYVWPEENPPEPIDYLLTFSEDVRAFFEFARGKNEQFDKVLDHIKRSIPSLEYFQEIYTSYGTKITGYTTVEANVVGGEVSKGSTCTGKLEFDQFVHPRLEGKKVIPAKLLGGRIVKDGKVVARTDEDVEIDARGNIVKVNIREPIFEIERYGDSHLDTENKIERQIEAIKTGYENLKMASDAISEVSKLGAALNEVVTESAPESMATEERENEAEGDVPDGYENFLEPFRTQLMDFVKGIEERSKAPIDANIELPTPAPMDRVALADYLNNGAVALLDFFFTHGNQMAKCVSIFENLTKAAHAVNAMTDVADKLPKDKAGKVMGLASGIQGLLNYFFLYREMPELEKMPDPPEGSMCMSDEPMLIGVDVLLEPEYEHWKRINRDGRRIEGKTQLLNDYQEFLRPLGFGLREALALAELTFWCKSGQKPTNDLYRRIMDGKRKHHQTASAKPNKKLRLGGV